DPAALITAWKARNSVVYERFRQVLADLRSSESPDLAMLSVAMRELRNLSSRLDLTRHWRLDRASPNAHARASNLSTVCSRPRADVTTRPRTLGGAVRWILPKAAFLVLLSAPARARIIASNLLLLSVRSKRLGDRFCFLHR